MILSGNVQETSVVRTHLSPYSEIVRRKAENKRLILNPGLNLFQIVKLFAFSAPKLTVYKFCYITIIGIGLKEDLEI